MDATNEGVDLNSSLEDETDEIKNMAFLEKSWATLVEQEDFDGMDNGKEDLEPDINF